MVMKLFSGVFGGGAAPAEGKPPKGKKPEEKASQHQPKAQVPKNQSISSTVQTLPPKKEQVTSTNQLGQTILGGLNNLRNKAAMGAANLLSHALLNQTKDEAFLAALTNRTPGQKPIKEDLEQIVHRLPPSLRNLLPEVVKEIAGQDEASTEKLTQDLLIHILANVARHAYPAQAELVEAKKAVPPEMRVSNDQLIQDVTLHLVRILAEGLNDIDKKKIEHGEEITSKDFDELAEKLVEQFLPKEAGFWSFGAKIEKKLGEALAKKLSKGLEENYGRLDAWLEGKELPPREAIDSPVLGHVKPVAAEFILYLTNGFTARLSKEDEQDLSLLTGQGDFQKIAEKVSPGLSEMITGFIPEQFKELLTSELANIPRVTLPPALAYLKAEFPDQLDTVAEIEKVILKLEQEKGREAEAAALKSYLQLKKQAADHELKGVTQNLTQALLLRVIANVSRDKYGEKLQHLKQLQKEAEELKQQGFGASADQKMQELKREQVAVETLVKEVTLDFLSVIKEEFDHIEQASAAGTPVSKESFEPLSGRLLRRVLPKEPLLMSFVDRRKKVLITPLAAKLEKVYNFRARKDETEEYIGRLETVVGNHQLAEQLYNLCGHGVKMGQDGLTHTASDKENIVRLFQGFSKTAGFAGLIGNVAGGFSSIFEGSEEHPDPTTGWVADNIRQTVHLTIFKGFVHLLEKVDPKDRQPPENLFPAAILLLMNTGSGKLPDVMEAIRIVSAPPGTPKHDPAHYIEDPELRDRKIQQVMAPLIDDYMTLLYDGNLIAHMHLPDEAEPWLKDIIRVYVPRLLAPMLSTTTRWIDDKQRNQDRLTARFGTQREAQFGRILGCLASDAASWAMQEFHEQAGNAVVKNAAHLFTSPEGQEPDAPPQDLTQIGRIVSHTLKTLSEPSSEPMQHTLAATGQADNEPMKKLYGFFEDFAESVILRWSADVFDKIHDMEEAAKDDPDGNLGVQLAVLGLGELQDHVETIAAVKSTLKKYKAGKISTKVMKREFEKAGKLHPALAPLGDKSTTVDHKVEFFERLSHFIFNFMEVDKDAELPLPELEFFRGPAWEVFEGKLMPLLLKKLLHEVRDPHTLNLILITLFKEINESAGHFDMSAPEAELQKYADAPQEKLEQISGDMLRALVRLQPTAFTKWLMEFRKVREGAGKAMALPLREELENTTILQIVDRVITNVTPKITPGYWKEDGEYVCQEKQPDGIMAVVAKPGFRQTLLPRTPEEKAAVEKRRTEEVKEAKDEVVQQIAGGIETPSKLIFLQFFKKLYAKIRGFINKAIDKIFRKYSPKVKAVVNKFLDGLGDYLVKPLLWLVTWPIFYVVKKILRFYFVYQAENRAQDVRHKIHKNPIFKLLSKMMDIHEGKVEPLTLEQQEKNEKLAIQSLLLRIDETIEILKKDPGKHKRTIKQLKKLRSKAEKMPSRLLEWELNWVLKNGLKGANDELKAKVVEKKEKAKKQREERMEVNLAAT